MNKSFMQINLILILLIHNIHCFGMITAQKSKYQKNITGMSTKQPSAIEKMHFFERLHNTSKLLLKPAPFNFSALSPDLQIRIASFTTPESISNLSETCRFLNTNLSLQSPHVWNIVRHSLNCISETNMERLLLKACLCNKHDIKNMIIENKYIDEQCTHNWILSDFPHNATYPMSISDWCVFLSHRHVTNCPLLEYVRTYKHNEEIPLNLAILTGDITVITNAINNSTITGEEINASWGDTIHGNYVNIILLLRQKEKELFFYNCEHNRALYEFARELDRIKAFETLIACDDRLNEKDLDGGTYLDQLIAYNAKPVFIDIVKKYDGKTKKEIDASQQLDWRMKIDDLIRFVSRIGQRLN